MKGIFFVYTNERCLLPKIQKMSNQYFSNPQKKRSQWKYECLAIRCALFGMIFCDLLERFSEVTLNHLVIVFVKIQRSTNLFNVKELKESHQKPIIFHRKNSPNFPRQEPNLPRFVLPASPALIACRSKEDPGWSQCPRAWRQLSEQMTRLHGGQTKKWAPSKTFPKKKTGTCPRPATFTVCEGILISLLKLWGCRPAFFGVCWSFLGATLRPCFVMKQNSWVLYWFCVEMTALICNLKKAACKQVLHASTEIALIYDDILCTRISTFVDAFPWYFNCSGWRMKSHAL